MDSKKNKRQQQQQPQQPQIPSSIYQKDKSYFIIVNAKPNSKESQISGISNEAVDINIAAPPKDGEANEELIDYLSQALGIKKSQLSLSRGSKARDKLIEISGGFSSLHELHQKLLEAL